MDYSKDRMKGYLDKVVALNSYRYQAYEAVLEYVKPKWHGTEEEMLAFARQYDRFDPGLLSSALQEVFWVYTDDTSEDGEAARLQEVQRKVMASKDMALFEESLFGYLKVHPENMEYWKSLLYWDALAGREEVVLGKARQFAQANPEIKALPDWVYLEMVRQSKLALARDLDRVDFGNRPEIVQGTKAALLSIAESDRVNWRAWNELAFYCLKHRDTHGMKGALDIVGDHWEGEVWPKTAFDEAVALSKKCTACGGTGLASCGAPGCVNGTIRCPNHCLQWDEGDWIHMHEAGHPDTDIWRKYTTTGEGYLAWNQGHIGHKIDRVNGLWTDTGVCKVCGGSGRVPCPVCHGKGKCPTCHGTGLPPKVAGPHGGKPKTRRINQARKAAKVPA